MTYTIIINTKDNKELVFKHIKSFYAEPGRIKLFKGKWIPIDGVEGLILHEEHGLINDACKEFADALRKGTFEISEVDKQQAIINHVLHEESDMSRLSDDEKRYFTDQITMLKNENERLTDRIEDLKAENEALRDCATHKPGCHESGNECICGLDALLTEEQGKK